jgi:hypothetical protein
MTKSGDRRGVQSRTQKLVPFVVASDVVQAVSSPWTPVETKARFTSSFSIRESDSAGANTASGVPPTRQRCLISRLPERGSNKNSHVLLPREDSEY